MLVAPALAQADVGLAVGGGTDVAVESADMVLMRADIFSVFIAIDLSHAILRCIKRNLFWALGYNVFAIPLAAGLSLVVFQTIFPPWVAGGAMAMSSVSVVLSSLTLSLYSPPKCTYPVWVIIFHNITKKMPVLNFTDWYVYNTACVCAKIPLLELGHRSLFSQQSASPTIRCVLQTC